MAFSFKKVCSNTLPVGVYKAQITNISFRNSVSDDMKYDLNVKYTIAEGEYAKHTITEPIFENAFSFRLKPFLTAIGMDMNREFESARELYEYGIKEAEGKFVMIEVGTRSYNGNEYNTIKNWAAVASSSVTMDDVLSEFGSIPEIMPEKPTVEEVINTGADSSEEPIVEVSDEDSPW